MSNLSVFAAEFEGMPVRATGDGRFSVYDVLVAFKVAKTNRNAPQVWKRLSEAHPELITKCDQFNFPGRGRNGSPVASDSVMYEVLMVCPGGLAPQFREWAAGVLSDPNKAMSLAVRKYMNQGKTPEWIHSRLDGILTRHKFTDILKEHGVNGVGYALCTDAINKGLFDRTAKELQAERNVKHTRDGLDDVEIAAIHLTEAMARKTIRADQAKGNEWCKIVCQDTAAKVRKALD